MVGFIVLVFLQASLFAWSQGGACHDIVTSACSAGVVHDGTGSARTPAERSEAFEQAYRFAESQLSPELAGVSETEKKEIFSRLNSYFKMGVNSQVTLTPREQALYSRYENILQSRLLQSGGLERIRSTVFPRVKEILITKLEQLLPRAYPQRAAILQRVRDIQMSSEPCVPVSGATEIFRRLSANTPSFRASQNTFCYGNGSLLYNQSEFSMVTAVAHELAHAVDPCLLTFAPGFSYTNGTEAAARDQAFYAPQVLSCLRGDRSLQASVHPKASSTTTTRPANPVKDALRARLARSPAPSPFPQEARSGPQSACESTDQIGEGFADWLSAEVLSEYLNKHLAQLNEQQVKQGLTNILRGTFFCKDGFAGPVETGEEHTPAAVRFNAIYASHPEIRVRMGCSGEHPQYGYCSPRRTNSAPAATPPTTTPRTESSPPGVH